MTAYLGKMDQIEDLEATPDDLIKQHKQEQFSVNYSDAPTQDTETFINILGGTDRTGQWAVPKTVRVFSLLGGANIDFTDAKFASPNVHIKIFSILSGDNIFVPEGVNIVSKAFCILGGIDNKATSIASYQAPTITVEGVILLSRLNIKIKTTIKEKFMEFATQMKSMFEGKTHKNHTIQK